MKFPSIVVGTMKLGSWGARFSTAEYEYFIDQCLDVGLNYFDHADIYGGYTTEEEFGDAIRKRPDLKSKVKLITKCGIAYPSDRRAEFKIKHYNTSGDYITKSIDQSLKNLGVDELELFLIHRPDRLLNPEEVAKTIDKAQKEGKVKHFGVSNFTTSQFEMLNTSIPLATNQIEISITHLDPFNDGSLDQLTRHKIQPMAWSPLAGGRVFSGNTEQDIRIRDVATRLAHEHQTEPDAILLAWLMKHPAGIVPVIGTSKFERVKKGMKATEIVLSHQEWYELWVASSGEKVA